MNDRELLTLKSWRSASTVWQRRAYELERHANDLHAQWELDEIGLRTALPADQAVKFAELRARAEVLRDCAAETEGFFKTLAETRETNKKIQQRLAQVDSLLITVREALRHLYKTARTGQWSSSCQQAWEALEKFSRETTPT